MLGIRTESPELYIIVAFLLGLLYSYFLYRKQELTNNNIKIFLFSLRTLFVFCLLLLLLNPIASVPKKTEERPILVLAQDASISCKEIDDYNNFNLLQNRFQEEGFEVFTYHYSDDIDEGFTSKKEGKSTNIGKLIDEVDVRFSGRNLFGVLLSSDGLFNDGVNPLYHQSSKSIPLHTILLGDTMKIKDVEIVDVLHNEISFLENRSPVEVQIKTEKFKGKNLDVLLYQDNKLIQKKSVNIRTNSDFINLNFLLDHDRIGLQRYKVLVDPLDGEEDINNNSFIFFVDVLDDQHRILILSDITHPDIAAVRSVLAKMNNYEVDFFKTEDFIPILDEYHLVITFYLVRTPSNILQKLEESDVSLLMFVNPSSVSLLDVIYPSGSVSGRFKYQEVTPSYNTDFTKFSLSPSLQDYFSNLPPLYSIFGNYNSSINSEALLYQKIGMYDTEDPLIILDQTIDRKLAIVYGEGVWRWKIVDKDHDVLHQNFDELFSKVSQYLLVKENKNRFRVSFDKKVTEGEEMIFKCEYYDENYILNNTKEVEHTIINENGNKFKFVYSKRNSSYYLNLGALPPGVYSFSSSYNNGSETFSGKFTIVPKKIESSIHPANHQLLYQLSQQSNGITFSEFNVDHIIDTLAASDLNKIIIHEFEILESAINEMWILILLISFISCEWIARKYHGLP